LHLLIKGVYWKLEVIGSTEASFTEGAQGDGLVQDETVLVPVLDLDQIANRSNLASLGIESLGNDESSRQWDLFLS
jgi:hypothetical protein